MGTLKEMLSADRFAAEAGVELLEISPGYAKARMKVTEKHLNAGGVCQGGALFTLADLAFAAVANSRGEADFVAECEYHVLACGEPRLCVCGGY